MRIKLAENIAASVAGAPFHDCIGRAYTAFVESWEALASVMWLRSAAVSKLLRYELNAIASGDRWRLKPSGPAGHLLRVDLRGRPDAGPLWGLHGVPRQ
jgi:hypothetical protein